MTSKIPRGVFPEKKTGQKPESKDSAVNALHKTDVRQQKENIPRKNFIPKAAKGVSTRYGQQAELKGQNQNLLIANDELQKNLTDTQHRVTELEEQCSDLEREKVEISKNLRDCHALLVQVKIDPVLGERVGEDTQQNQEQRQEVMTVSTELLNELQTFADIASEQSGRLQEIQSTLSELTKTQEQMRQERAEFALETAALKKALNEAEALLL